LSSEGCKVPYLDCCAMPNTVTIKTMYDESHNTECLCRCQNCGAYWFWRWHETINFSGGDDDLTVWYSRLTPEQGRLILEAKERPELKFLSDAPTFIENRGVVRQTTGQPTGPFV